MIHPSRLAQIQGGATTGSAPAPQGPGRGAAPDAQYRGQQYGYADAARPSDGQSYGQTAKPAAYDSRPSGGYYGSSAMGYGRSAPVAPASHYSAPAAYPSAAPAYGDMYGRSDAYSSTSSAPSAYGQPPSSAYSQSSSAYGQPSTTSSAYGQPSTSSAYGQPSTTSSSSSAYGQPSTTSSASAYGQPSSSSSAYGQPSTASSSSSAYGQPPSSSWSGAAPMDDRQQQRQRARDQRSMMQASYGEYDASSHTSRAATYVSQSSVSYPAATGSYPPPPPSSSSSSTSTTMPQYGHPSQQHQAAYRALDDDVGVGRLAAKRDAPESGLHGAAAAAAKKLRAPVVVAEKSAVNLLAQPSEFRGQTPFYNTLPPLAHYPLLLSVVDRHDAEPSIGDLANLRAEQYTPFPTDGHTTLGGELDLVDLAAFLPAADAELLPEDDCLLQLNPKLAAAAAVAKSSKAAPSDAAAKKPTTHRRAKTTLKIVGDDSNDKNTVVDNDDNDVKIDVDVEDSDDSAEPLSLRAVVEEIASRIDKSFDEAKRPPQHDGVRAESVWPILPEISLWPELVETVMFEADPLMASQPASLLGQCVLDTQKRIIRLCVPTTQAKAAAAAAGSGGQMLEDARVYVETQQRDDEPEYLLIMSDLQAGYVPVRKQRKLRRAGIEHVKQLKQAKRNVLVRPRDLTAAEKERRDLVFRTLTGDN